MKKKLISVMMTGALCASMVIPAMADTVGGANPTERGTDVLAGITLDDPDAKIQVDVPTLFAFVVNGTVGTDTSAVESQITIDAAGGTGTANILLPNIKVKVDRVSGGTDDPATPDVDESKAAYHLETEASGNLKFVNYSTKKGTQVDGRDGLPVGIIGSIKNEGTDASRNYWTHVADATANQTGTNGAVEDFKKYTLEVSGEKFSKVETDGSFAMANPIALPAPDLTAGGVDPDTLYANVGKEIDPVFNVYVGGQRGQYKQVEESAKVGTIVWTLQAEQQVDAVDTAPDEGYLHYDPVTGNVVK